MDDVLIVGVDGLIGKALETRLRRDGRKVIGTSRRPFHETTASAHRVFLDLANPTDINALPASVSVAYILAAVTSMAQCEHDTAFSRRVNVSAPLELAARLARSGAHVVFVSSNLVLSGERPRAPVTSEISPANLYAAQKAEVERDLLAKYGSSSVLRTTKIAETLAGVVKGWRAEAEQGRAIRAFKDLVCAPLPLAYVIDALVGVGERRRSGIFQVSADQDLSYAEIATMFAARCGYDPALVQPILSTEAGVTLTACPKHTTLDSRETEQELGLASIRSIDALESIFARQLVDATGSSSV